MEIIKYDLPIYTFDIDFNGHVSNIVYIRWLEIGRLKLLEHVGMPVTKIVESGFGPLLAETTISYKKPLLLSDSVSAHLWVSELGKASAWLDFQFFNGSGEVAATARQRGLFVNFATGKPHRITDEQRALFRPYLMTDAVEKT